MKCDRCSKRARVLFNEAKKPRRLCGTCFENFLLDRSRPSPGEGYHLDLLLHNLLHLVFGSGSFLLLEEEAGELHPDFWACPECGLRMSQFLKGEKPGCKSCYGVLKDLLHDFPSQNLGISEELRQSLLICCEHLEKLEVSLEELLHQSAYEEAVALRDSIFQWRHKWGELTWYR